MPLSEVHDLLKAIANNDHEKANALSVAVAKLHATVIMAFSSFGKAKKPPEIDLRKMLPYPDQGKEASNQISDRTSKVLRRLIAARKIPLQLYAALCKKP